jgi:hypothetical protein
VGIRLWWDQPGQVPLDAVTFGVRYVGESKDPVPVHLFTSPFHWRQYVRIERDGKTIEPKVQGFGEDGRPPDSVVAMLEYGQSRELTFKLSDAIELGSLGPGRYLLSVNLGRTPVRTHAVQFEVRDEGGRRVARPIAQGVPLATQPATVPTSLPLRTP